MLQSMKKGHRQSGFTLIELMFTVILLAVILGFGLPNFRDFIRNSHMTAAANDLISDYNLARSEAVKRRVPVTICKSTNGTACDTSNTSEFARWIVFVDDANSAAASANDGDGEVDAGETVLRDRRIEDAITATSNGRLTVFRSNGFPNLTVGGSLSRVLFCDERGSAISTGGVSAARGVGVTTTGRASVSREKARIDAATTSGGFGGCP
jgi:type IV fimbrial biogenesis protein FimT